MHRVDGRTYVGTPNELVTVTTQLGAGGQVKVEVDGQDIGAARQFPLSATQGAMRTMQITLSGPVGATCAVGISTVGGGSDGDFLMAQAHNPMPSNIYRFSTAASTAIRALADARREEATESAAAPVPRAAKRAKAAKKKAKAAKTKKRGRQ